MAAAYPLGLIQSSWSAQRELARGAIVGKRYQVERLLGTGASGEVWDAEDLAQLVFVKALEALPRYELRGVPFGGWLFRLARNVVIDHVRTRREHVTLDVIGEKSTDDQGPDELAVLRQEMDSIAHALRRLTPEQREAVELRFFAGLSAKEAAEAMGRQEGTVRGLQFRAIAALRRELGIAPDIDELGRVSGTAR